MTLLALLIACNCGTTVIANSGLEDWEGVSLDGRGTEECGPNRGAWAFTFDEDVSSWAGTREVALSLGMDSRESALDWWTFEIAFPWSEARQGNTISLEDGNLYGSPCWLTNDGCDGGLGMSRGEITFHDFRPDDDPCDPFAQLHMDISWDLEFGEVDSDSYWATAKGSDLVPLSIDWMCEDYLW